MHIDILCSNCYTVIDHIADLCECGLSSTAPTCNIYVEGPCNHRFCDKLGDTVENQCTKDAWVAEEGSETDPREEKEISVKM
jgi:hypothetical protein